MRIILFPFHLTLLSLVTLCLLTVTLSAQAQQRTVNLTVAYKQVNFAGKQVRAIAVNNQVPGPTLHFTEGDTVTINVYNHLDRGTSIHWHGLIIPWKMDGVDSVTQHPIPPGGVFHYHFTLHQSGTYWYHAHSDLQEQEGDYGAMIIAPKHPTFHANKDFAIVLSDWSNSSADQVYANLKKEGDFYSLGFPMQASLVQFFRDYHAAKTPAAKTGIVNAYKMMQNMRMSIYDYSDIAYDAFLLNGHPATSPWTANVNVGDTVRLRFIGAGASTIFHVKIPGTSMQMIQADGNNIKPYSVTSFTIAPGETFDVLITIKKPHPYIIYAESIDSLGAAIGALTTAPHQPLDVKAIHPFPRPKPIMMMNHNMPGMKMDGANSPAMMGHSMPATDTPNPHAMMGHNMAAMDGANKQAMMNHSMQPTTQLASLSSETKYDQMQSPVKTNNPATPVHTIHMKLSGYMDRYIWFLNGVPEYKAKPIMIKHGQWYRIIFTNTTMMHHPMHIHGHWFILRNGHGAHDPKLHTLDIPPGATVVADFHANETGQWFFHCHNLTHMKAGMANIFRYEDTPQQAFVGLSGHKSPGWYNATELELSGDFINNSYEGTIDSLLGSDYNKLQLYSKDAEIEDGKVKNANIDAFYWHLLSQFWAIKGGVNYVYRPASTAYLQPGIGIEGLMPYFIQTDIRAYLHDGSAKFDVELARNTQITHHIFLRLSLDTIIATKTLSNDEIGSGFNSLEWTVQPTYQFNANVGLFLQYQGTAYFGALNHMLADENDATQDNSYSIGVNLLF